MDLTNKKRKNGFDRASVLDLSTLVYGKVPPQAKGLEEVVLGAILLEKGAFDVAAEILTAEAFYVDGHQRIFRAMQSLALKSKPIDILTLEEELRTKEDLDLIGGPYYLTKLTNSVVSAANIETHARIIHEKFLKREQIRICGEGLNMAYEDSTDAFECLDHLSGKIGELAMVGVSSDGQDIASVLVERVQYLHEMNDSVDEVIGIPTGFPILDKITRGWIAGYLIILAARPSVGKTALALNLARNAAADLNKPTAVAYWSLEMGAGELTDRMISAESGVSYEDISKARLSEDQMRRLYLPGCSTAFQVQHFHGLCPLAEHH
jgi:replicative DNA helicase